MTSYSNGVHSHRLAETPQFAGFLYIWLYLTRKPIPLKVKPEKQYTLH